MNGSKYERLGPPRYRSRGLRLAVKTTAVPWSVSRQPSSLGRAWRTDGGLGSS